MDPAAQMLPFQSSCSPGEFLIELLQNHNIKEEA
jgi:hypothetical protein